ncbi:MAG TPA: GGDEF domain-containing protein [Gemmatimonadales bacterium]|nr:GGDEF domain-containing protein [Gemmatimonadales bacterium]
MASGFVAGTVLPLLVGGVVGFLSGRWLRRRTRPALAGQGPDPYLLPDPAVRWLAEARGALGVWVREAPRDGEGEPRWHRATAAGKLAASAIQAVEERLQQLHGQGASGAERLDAGTLVYGSNAGITAGLLLPADAPAGTLQQVGDDLVRLLDGLARRPLFRRLEVEAGAAVESLGSVGLRLAYQLERILNAEVIVAAVFGEAVRVIGTSGRADRRLLDTFAVPGSPLYQVARGEVPSLTSIADPLGGIVHDRRTHFAPAIILPIKHGDEVVGAVAFWTDDEAAPIAPVIAEVQEAIRNAGPRIVRARRDEEQGNAAITDPLTGLRNRRGLEEAMHRVGVNQGALIYADMDKFKLLNDTLGHPAGDAALVHFARLIHDQIRGGDVAARIGGEEFAIWLPGANLVYGTKVAERIRVKLATSAWDWQGRRWPLSASFGVAAIPDVTRSVDNLPALADAALLEAKRQGRDRVETAKTR